ncbi:MAG: hypothetical protein J6W14_03975, partial [Clostridia bacterium]|nr:hypothetical protein [Clostridia bacterium]
AGGATILGCSSSGNLAAGIHAIQRVGADTSGRNFEVTRACGVGTFVRLPQNNTFFVHDPDCASFTAKVSHGRNLDFLEAAAVSGALTVASVTPKTLTSEEMARIRGIFKIASQGGLGAIPTDWLGHQEPTTFETADGRRFVFDWYSDYRGVRQFYSWGN